MTPGESTKFLKEISAVIRNAKKVPNKSKEDTDKETKEAYNRYLKSK
jgi:hypothetical protein